MSQYAGVTIADIEIAKGRMLDARRDCRIGNGETIFLQLFLPSDTKPSVESKIMVAAASIIKSLYPDIQPTLIGPVDGCLGIEIPEDKLRGLRTFIREEQQKLGPGSR